MSTEREPAASVGRSEMTTSLAVSWTLADGWPAFLRDLPSPAMILGTDHRILAANSAAVATVGMPLDAMAGRRCCKIMHDTPEAPAGCPLASVVASGDWAAEAMDVETLGGTYRVSCTPLWAGDGQVAAVLHLMQDVTDVIAEEDERERRLRLDSLGHLAGGLAHELNNSFAGIMGFAEMLQHHDLAPQAEDCVDGILRGCERCSDTTKDLLAFSGRGRYTVDQVDMHPVIREILSEARAEHPHLQISETLAADHQVVEGDRGQLTRLTNALIRYAAQRMPEGGRLSVSTSSQPGAADECCTLSVKIRDTGPALDAVEITRLFEPFYHGVTTGRQGLSMAAAHGIAYGHGGSLLVRSTVGCEGAELSVRLPAQPAEALPPEQSESPVPEPRPRKPRILIVDDERSVRRTGVAFLERAGYEAVACEGSDEALALIEPGAELFDLVILDMLMPGMRGDQLLVEIRRVMPDVVALLATGYAFGSGGPAVDLTGFAEVLRKPYSRTELVDLVDTHLPVPADDEG